MNLNPYLFSVAVLTHSVFNVPYIYDPHPFALAGVSLGSVDNSLPPGVPQPDINVEPSVPDTESDIAQNANSI